jgi:hypothetical protein
MKDFFWVSSLDIPCWVLDILRNLIVGDSSFLVECWIFSGTCLLVILPSLLSVGYSQEPDCW